MGWKKILPLLLMVSLLGACSSLRQTDADPNIQGGLSAVSKGQYEKAAAYFELAKTTQSSKAVDNYQEQLAHMILIEEKLQQGDLSGAEEQLKQLSNYTLTRSFQQKFEDLTKDLDTKQQTIAAVQKEIADLETLIKEKKFNESQSAIEKLLAQDLSPSYYLTDRQKLQELLQQYFRERVADWETQKQQEQAAIEAKNDLVPASLQDVWYGKLPTQDNADYENPILKLTGTTLYDYRTDRVYEIIAVQWQGNNYMLQWDMNRFAQRYGNQALGNDPLPFQFTLVPATDETPYRTLKAVDGDYYSE